MKSSERDQEFKAILGSTYGGPSISYDAGTDEFVIYRWYDAPVGMDVLASSKTIEGLLKDFQEQQVRREEERKQAEADKKKRSTKVSRLLKTLNEAETAELRRRLY